MSQFFAHILYFLVDKDSLTINSKIFLEQDQYDIYRSSY